VKRAADPQRQRVAEERLHPPPHRERGVQRALGVILQRVRSSERSHHCIAGELLDGASGVGDLGGHRLVEPVERDPRSLGILRRR
jgi:hypothetical protein